MDSLEEKMRSLNEKQSKKPYIGGNEKTEASLKVKEQEETTRIVEGINQ